MTERSPGRWPGSRTGCGEIRYTANSATPNPATSSQYTKRTPAPASSSPASAGPATRPNWNSAWKMAFAVDTSDRRTAQQRPGDQREQLGDGHQPDVERRVGQLVHLVRHRHRGQLVAQDGHELAPDQVAEVARPPQRRQVDEQAPRGPGLSLPLAAHPRPLPNSD